MNGRSWERGERRRRGPRAGCFSFESSSRSSLLLEHDLFRKPVPTFRDHALGRCRERQRDAEPRATPRAILDRDGAAVALDQVLGNGQAQSRTATLAVAGRIETKERLEDSLAFARWDA